MKIVIVTIFMALCLFPAYRNHNLEEQAKAILDQNCLAHKTLKVGDIVSFANGFAFESSTYIEKGKFKVVTIKNVQDGKIDTSSADCVHEIPAKMKAECILNIGDVLLSLTGNVGRTGIVCENNLLLNQRVAKIIPHQSVLNAVCYFIFRRPEMKAALETIASGYVKNLNTLLRFLCFPPSEPGKNLSVVLQFLPV